MSGRSSVAPPFCHVCMRFRARAYGAICSLVHAIPRHVAPLARHLRYRGVPYRTGRDPIRMDRIATIAVSPVCDWRVEAWQIRTERHMLTGASGPVWCVDTSATTAGSGNLMHQMVSSTHAFNPPNRLLKVRHALDPSRPLVGHGLVASCLSCAMVHTARPAHTW